MKRIICMFLLLAGVNLAFSIEAIDILRKLDANEIYDSIKYNGEMQVFISGKKYVKTFTAYTKGNKNSFMEFTDPENAGTKYLKKDGNLFIYSPDSEKVIPITGHMLKESIMGSDMSYEDTLENTTLESRYNVTIAEETKFSEKDVWVIELTAKKKTESYAKQKIWIDKENFVALKTELYALSGSKLKEYTMISSEKIKNRIFATEFEMKDLLKKNSKTVLKMNKIEMDINIPDSMFSMKNLEK